MDIRAAGFACPDLRVYAELGSGLALLMAVTLRLLGRSTPSPGRRTVCPRQSAPPPSSRARDVTPALSEASAHAAVLTGPDS